MRRIHAFKLSPLFHFPHYFFSRLTALHLSPHPNFLQTGFAIQYSANRLPFSRSFRYSDAARYPISLETADGGQGFAKKVKRAREEGWNGGCKGSG